MDGLVVGVLYSMACRLEDDHLVVDLCSIEHLVVVLYNQDGLVVGLCNQDGLEVVLFILLEDLQVELLVLLVSKLNFQLSSIVHLPSKLLPALHLRLY